MEYFDYCLKAYDAPIDISFVFEDEKPAGKHGFMKCVGDHFEFEDGTSARFWGVNFNGGANFPEHEDAEKVAKRLAKFGINMVRFHQLDAEWNTPNIFPPCAGLARKHPPKPKNKKKTSKIKQKKHRLLSVFFCYCRRVMLVEGKINSTCPK